MFSSDFLASIFVGVFPPKWQKDRGEEKDFVVWLQPISPYMISCKAVIGRTKRVVNLITEKFHIQKLFIRRRENSKK